MTGLKNSIGDPRFNCYEKLWLYIDKADYKALRRDFTVIRRNPENDIYVDCGQ